MGLAFALPSPLLLPLSPSTVKQLLILVSRNIERTGTLVDQLHGEFHFGGCHFRTLGRSSSAIDRISCANLIWFSIKMLHPVAELQDVLGPHNETGDPHFTGLFQCFTQ